MGLVRLVPASVTGTAKASYCIRNSYSPGEPFPKPARAPHPNKGKGKRQKAEDEGGAASEVSGRHKQSRILWRSGHGYVTTATMVTRPRDRVIHSGR